MTLLSPQIKRLRNWSGNMNVVLQDEAAGERVGGTVYLTNIRRDGGYRQSSETTRHLGKTKVMSLAIVWSYFHALRESDSSRGRVSVISS